MRFGGKLKFLVIFPDAVILGKLPDRRQVFYQPVHPVDVSEARELTVTVGNVGSNVQSKFITEMAIKSGFKVQRYCGGGSSSSNEQTVILICRWPSGQIYHAAMFDECFGTHHLSKCARLAFPYILTSLGYPVLPGMIQNRY